MQKRKAVDQVLIDGKDITPGMVAVVTSITIVDGEGKKPTRWRWRAWPAAAP
ncbi:hypothetical protein AB6806_10930 [Bosea sp. RCC_152_1]|uniref:hypothetical protein n=1 Tax=Bosea sp. RCC_152_1 TaxID=3239228 RepID=UPI00352605F8